MAEGRVCFFSRVFDELSLKNLPKLDTFLRQLVVLSSKGLFSLDV
jgi:hypothetical protein